MSNTLTKTQTFLPVFPGFYGTVFEPDHHIDNEMYEVNSIRKDKGWNELDYEYFNFNIEEYMENISEECVSALEYELKEKGFIHKIEYEKLNSPRQYNFSNDSIDVEIVLTEDNIHNIKSFISDNYELWAKYLKEKYTSYDGFMSFYDNTPDSEDWEDLNECIEDCHKLGSILEFICYKLDITSFTLYELCETHLFADNYNELIETEDPTQTYY